MTSRLTLSHYKLCQVPSKSLAVFFCFDRRNFEDTFDLEFDLKKPTTFSVSTMHQCRIRNYYCNFPSFCCPPCTRYVVTESCHVIQLSALTWRLQTAHSYLPAEVNGGQECSRVVKSVQGWSRVVKGGQGWSRVVKVSQEWSRVVKSGQEWSWVVKGGQGWSTVFKLTAKIHFWAKCQKTK